MNWVHQRHAFLAQQYERHLAAAPVPSENERREWVTEWWHRAIQKNDLAPRGLRLFGETGVAKMSVIVSEADVTMGTCANYASGASKQWPEISAFQTDYRRAKLLFPEAQIRPVQPEEWAIKYRGGEKSDWLRPLVIREQASKTIVRLLCDSTVVEGNHLFGMLEATPSSESCVIVEYRTCDGTATAQQRNFVELIDTILFQPRQSQYAIILRIGRLTEEQRAAGGATFKIKLGTVVGAVADVTEKTITILPRQETNGGAELSNETESGSTVP